MGQDQRIPWKDLVPNTVGRHWVNTDKGIYVDR